MYTILPYGISSSLGIFQWVIENLLPGITYVIVKLDDILVSGKNDVELLRNLEEVLKWFSNVGLSVFMVSEVVYCGHKVTTEGITPVKANVQVVQETPRPQNTSKLKSYLGK